MAEAVNQPTVTEARAILQQETLEREKTCWLEIEEVLKKHNCQFDVTVILRAGQMIPRVGVASK